MSDIYAKFQNISRITFSYSTSLGGQVFLSHSICLFTGTMQVFQITLQALRSIDFKVI